MASFKHIISYNKKPILYPFFNNYVPIPILMEVKDLFYLIDEKTIEMLPRDIWEKILFFKFVKEKIQFCNRYFSIYREALLVKTKKSKEIIKRNNLQVIYQNMKQLKNFLSRKVFPFICLEGCEGICYHHYANCLWKNMRNYYHWILLNTYYYPQNKITFQEKLLTLFQKRLKELEDNFYTNAYLNAHLNYYVKHTHETQQMITEMFLYLTGVNCKEANKLEDKTCRNCHYRMSLLHS